jgi:hypothetical protein
MDDFKRHSNKEIGPGGIKCVCCGPAPKDRPKLRRRTRKRMAQELRKQLNDGESCR